jgi:hypothetical protein
MTATHGGAWYLGADPASIDAGLAAFNEAGELRHLALHATGQMPARLASLRRDARQWLQPIADDGAWCCVIERPAAHHGGPTLLAAYGVIVEVVASLLRCPVLTELPSVIDDAAGVVKASGADRKARLRARARELGYDGPSQDVADAVVAAEAARALTLRALPSGVAA